MFHQKTGLLLQSTITALLFCLLLTHCCRGQSQVMGPSQPIVATLGDDIILPSYLEPAYDATTVTVEWARPDLNPRFIYVSRGGHDLERMKNPSYKGRTSMFIDELKHGNISLKISKVKQADAGRYRCFVPELNEDRFMELVVVSGAVSQPVTTLAGVDGKGGVVLQCESAGWYPEPEVLWLDAEGNLLSAGPTETVRGPDDLYTVSSRVTVEKKHSNKFTCRVQQNNINQTRQTWIHVPDDFFVVQSCSTSTTVSLAVCMVVSIILFILAVVVFVHTRRQNRTRRKEDVQVKSEDEALISMKTLEKEKQPESKRMEKEYDDIIKQLHQEKEERKKVENEVKTLKNELQKLKEEELKQKEDQRRNEAENTIQRLKEKLDMKKTEVENKQSELQRFQEEKKKIQKDLQNLNKDLNTKNTQLKTITEELAKSSWTSYFSRTDARKEKLKNKETEKKIQREIENLSKQLMTKKTEFQNKDEECEEKQVELKQLLDDQQKMEIKLQIEEQKLMRKEYDDIITPLQLETEERKKAENEVKMLKNDLKEWMKTERKLKTEILNMILELDETDSQYPQWRHENVTGGNQPEELERNNSKINNQFQQEKQKNETLNSRLEELKVKLKEKKLKWTETEETLKKELNQWMKTGRNLKIGIVNMIQKLQNEKLSKTEGKLKTGIQNMNKELEEMMRLMTGPIAVVEVHKEGSYICLKNISTEEIKLGGWDLELQIDSRETDIYTFHESVKLEAGEILTIWRPGFCTTHPDGVNLVWSGLNKWRPEDMQQINIISNNGEIFRLL